MRRSPEYSAWRWLLLAALVAWGMVSGCTGAAAVEEPTPAGPKESGVDVGEEVRAFLVAWLGENERICNGVVVDAGGDGQGVYVVTAAHCGEPTAIGVPVLGGAGEMERQGGLWQAGKFAYASNPGSNSVNSLGDETSPWAYGVDAAAVRIAGRLWEVEDGEVSGGLPLGTGVSVGERVSAVGLTPEQLKRFAGRQVSFANPVTAEGVVVEGGDRCPELALVVTGELGLLKKGSSGEPVVRPTADGVEVVGVVTAVTRNGGFVCFTPAEKLQGVVEQVK